jgi:hypothetical protein
MELVRNLDRAIQPRSLLILSSHPCLDLLSGLDPSGLPTKILYEFLFSLMPATCHTHLIFFVLVTVIVLGEKYKL